MAREISAATFDYSQIEDKEIRGKLVHYEGQISRLKANVAKSVLELGKALCEARDLLADYHGGVFTGWLEVSNGFSQRSAYNYMGAWQVFGSFATVAKLEDTAMYRLAEPSTPKKAVTEAKKLADKGVNVTAKLAKELIEKYKDKTAAPVADLDIEESLAPEGCTAHDEGSAAVDTDNRTEPDEAVIDYGKCPNCGGKKWADGPEGVACERCHHPHGEAVGDVDDDRVKLQRSKTVKTAEALLRAFDDLQAMLPKPEHKQAVAGCKSLMKMAKDWT